MTFINTKNNESILLSFYFKMGNVLGVFPLISAGSISKWLFRFYIFALYTFLEACAVLNFIQGTYFVYANGSQTFHVFMRAYFVLVSWFWIIGVHSATQESNWLKLMANMAHIDDYFGEICFKDIGISARASTISFSYVLIVSLLQYEDFVASMPAPAILRIFSGLFWFFVESQGFFLITFVHQFSSLILKRYDYLNEIADAVANEQTTIKIRDITRIYPLLYESVINFNNIFGGYFIWFLSNSLMVLLWTCEGFLDDTVFMDPLDLWGNLFYVSIQIVYSLIMIVSCDRVEKSAKKLLQTSHYLQVETDDPSIRAELIHLSALIEKLLPEFSALGFFRINQRLIPAFLSSMTSYVIILIQFKNT